MAVKLITPVSAQVLDLADVKARLRITDSNDDTVLNALISEVRGACQDKSNRGIGAQTWQIAVDAFPAAIPLILPPLIAVDWVKYYDPAGVLQTLASNQYAVDDFNEPGWIVPAANVTWPETLDTINAVRVQIQCGYTAGTLPPSLQLWMLANIGHFHANREVFTDADRGQRTIVDSLLDAHRIWPCL